MIDVVNGTVTIADIDQLTQDINDVFLRQHPAAGRFRTSQSAVEFHPANSRQIITIRREEQIFKQCMRRLFGRRFTGSHHPVDFD